MALAVASVTTASSAGTGSVVINKPTGVAVGDLLLIIATQISDTAGIISSTGFTSRLAAEFSPGTVGPSEIAVLSRIADSSDVSASTYTVSGNSGAMGIVCMMRITGFGGATLDPIYSFDRQGYNPTVSGTFNATALSLSRRSQQLLIIFSSSGDDSDGDFLSYPSPAPTVTSTDSNPTWTEACNISGISVNSGFGAISLYVAYATTTNTSTITGYSHAYTENGNDNTIAAHSGLLILNEPISVTSDVGHLAVTPTILGITASQVNVAPTVGHLTVVPTIQGIESIATQPSQWTTTNKS